MCNNLSIRSRSPNRAIIASFFLLALLSSSFLGGRSAEAADVLWFQKTSMPSPRMEFGTAVVNDRIYAIGGYSGSTLSLVEEYDPTTDSWTRKADMPTPRRQLVVAAANDRIYAIGGMSFTNPNDVTYSFATEEYDPATNSWTTKADFPMPLPINSVLGNAFIGGVAANGKIYIVVFNTQIPGGTATYEYDPVLDVWDTIKSPVPFSNTRYSVATLGGKVYVMETGGDELTGSMAEYDPANDLWTIRPSATERLFHGLTATGNKLYAIGGLDNYIRPGMVLGTVEEFDPLTNSWELSTPILAARHSQGLAAVAGKIYVLGGANANDVPLSAVEEGNTGDVTGLSVCDLNLSLEADTLVLDFDLGTDDPVTWNLWLSIENQASQFWSIPLPVVKPVAPISVPIPSFPSVGKIGFLNTFVAPGEGIVCSSWKVIDTGV